MFDRPAHRLGLPRSFSGPSLPWILVLLWIHTAIHEAGHAITALAFGFRLRALCIGPLTWRRGHQAWRFHFDWRGLINGGGYYGAVPRSHEGVWRKEILAIAAGPAASLAAGFAFLGGFYLLPGTPVAPYAPMFALASVLGFYLFALNLIPSGYTDGKMLLHLILRTRRGEQLIAGILAGQEHVDAEDRRAECDFETALARRREALQLLLDAGESNSLPLAASYAELGLAELPLDSSRNQADAHLRQALKELATTSGHLGIEAACWVGLHRLAVLRQRSEEAAHACESGVQALEKMRSDAAFAADRFAVDCQLAELQVCHQAFEPALSAIEKAFEHAPRGSRHKLAKGTLLRLRADCEFQLGRPELALHAVEEAASIFRSDDSADAPRQLALLGIAVWNAGRVEKAAEWLAESVRLFQLRGAVAAAMTFRLALADVLCRDGRIPDAACVLPEPDKVSPEFRAGFLEQRGAIRLKGGYIEEAVADYRERMRLVAADPQASDLDVALAKNELAEAHFEAGNLTLAASLAHEAREALDMLGHPDAASACVTLALVGVRREERSATAWLREAMRIFSQAPLVLPASKARFFESSARKLEAAGLSEDAAQWRASADTCWRMLNLPSRAHAAEEIRQPIPA
jgi:tetratricopeptide (TPR) repeat protein